MRRFLLLQLITCLLLLPGFVFPQAPGLGSASGFALFTAAGAFNAAGASTVVTGDVGTNVGAYNAFPPGTLIGQSHVADAVSASAASDVLLAYGSMSTITCGLVISTTLGSGQTLLPNVYCMGAASTINGDLILDGQGDPTSLFIFKIDGALASTVNSRIILTNSASLCNVFWQVNGQVDLGENSIFQGTILANGAINLLDGATLYGRALSKAGAISLQNNIVTIAQQAVAANITANGPVNICAGGSVVLSGNIDGTWSTGATTPTITVSVAGDYSVTNTANCGNAVSNHIIVTVNPLPACSITGNTAICPGQSTQLCVAAGAASYLWSNGATTNCITVSSAGTYSVTVTSAAGCTSTCSQTVTVSDNPVCTITGNSAICPGQSTQLCVPAGAASYLWSNGATTNCITVNSAGTYSVTVTNAAGCTSTCSQVVTVSDNPVCTITGNSAICPGQSTQLCVPAGAASYLWSNGATTNCITVNSAGTYSVTVTNAGGCTSTCSQVVTVSSNPVCTITGNSAICPGQSTQLCVPAGAASYLWSNGATTNCITVSAAGTYSVTVTNAGGCTSTCSQVVTASSNPVCTITGNSAICPGQSTQLCVPAGAASYLWSNGATTNCITVNAAGTYSVTVTNAAGCTSTCSQVVTASSNPVCTITGNSAICPGQSTQLCVPAGAASYLWSNGATTNCITVNAAGTYSVTVTNAAGCTSTCSQVVTASSNPVCTITGNSAICPGQSTQLCVPAGAASYLWSNGATTNCITVNAAGTYSVTVTNAGGCTSTCSQAVTVSNNPVCTITGNSAICPGQSTQLCVPAGAASYLWSNGATTNCITVNSAGTYSVTVTNAGGCTSTCSQVVTISSNPVCTITGNSAICPGQSTQLCVPAGAASYLWSNGATTNCITVTAAGTYSVTVTNAAGCTSTCSQVVTVSSNPVCTITGNSAFCPGQSTQLCVPAGAASYLWSNGATTNCITVNAAGTYSVTVTNAAGCTSTCTKTVTASVLPVCTITGNSTICAGDSTQLCAPAGCSKYLWSNGATTQCITVRVAGTYTVTVTNAAGCTSTCTKTVTVSALPSCTITGNSTFCTGGSTQLCAPAGCTKYLWSNGATTQCITVTVAGTYTVTVTNAAGCTSTCTKTVTASVLPPCTITGTSTICAGDSTQLCAPAGCSKYLWSNGATTQCITVRVAGTYTVTVTNAAGCTSTCTKTVTVSALPSCTITGNSTFCTGGSTQLCAPAGCTKYLWSNGATTQCITVTFAGTYTVTVTNAAGCTSTCTKTVTASVLPVCTITGTSTICAGDSTQLCAPDGCTKYLWSNGATTQCITVRVAGTYTVTVTNAAGCTSTCTKTVTVSALPSCTITGNSTFCTGGSTQLCAPAGCTKYLWSNGATTQCITVTFAGTYTVTVTNAAGCTSTCTKTVTASVLPVCTITGTSTICAGDSTQLCAPASCTKYLWSNGATTQCIKVKVTGTYTVTVTNAAGCTSTCTKTVTVSPLPSCTITASSNTVCTGKITQLCAAAGGTRYQWSNGATTQFINVTVAGTYTVIVTNAAGCTSTCTKVLTASALPVCTITGSSTICAGTTTQLCAPAGCAKYLWSNGATTQCISVSAVGTYTVTVTNTAGCSSSCSKTVTALAAPVCTITGNCSLSPGASTKLCAPAGCSSYLWSNGATTQCITVSVAGTYTVTVSNASACKSTCSVTVKTVYPVTARPAAASPATATGKLEAKAFPNPFSTNSIIELRNVKSNTHTVVELYNSTGRKVATLYDQQVKQGGIYQVPVQAAKLPSGLYFFRVVSGDEIVNKEIIVIK